MHDEVEAAESRSDRGRERRSRRLRLALAVVAGVVGVLLIGAVAVAMRDGGRWIGLFRSKEASSPPLAASVTTRPLGVSSGTAGRIEVPDLSGMPLVQAQTLLQTAGLLARVSISATMQASEEQGVAAQSPAAGAVVGTGTVVVLNVPPALKGGKVASPSKRKGPLVVVIDPGHQSHADIAVEPIGPGSPTTQPKVTAGSTGAATHVPEYEIDLQIATNLKNHLEAAGVRVVMTRETNDVDLSNAQRAQIANAAKAALFIRIHADNSIDTSATGISTVYPAPNQWTKGFSARSRGIAQAVQGSVVAETGAADNGELARGDQAGFNWAKVPAILVNVGNPANPVEDKLLTSARYQDLLAAGITAGVLESFQDGG